MNGFGRRGLAGEVSVVDWLVWNVKYICALVVGMWKLRRCHWSRRRRCRAFD